MEGLLKIELLNSTRFLCLLVVVELHLLRMAAYIFSLGCTQFVRCRKLLMLIVVVYSDYLSLILSHRTISD